MTASSRNRKRIPDRPGSRHSHPKAQAEHAERHLPRIRPARQSTMDWDRLLTTQRLGDRGSGTRKTRRSPFQIDYDRVIFASAFRRLQDKTQVVPLAENDYVRTRLTHSLETSSIGRSLGARAGEKICASLTAVSLHPSDIGAIVAAACLAHDIGSPPFGHSGEDAIRDWFRSSDVAERLRPQLSAQQARDIENYEANAEGLRLLTQLEMPDREGGMRLTCATLAAYAKYPCCSTAAAGRRGDASNRKFNFFASEGDIFRGIAEAVGLLPDTHTPDRWCRHPLAFLVEAADDITYRLIDLEDGYRLGLITLQTIEELLNEVAGGKVNWEKAKAMSDYSRVEYLRARAFGKLVEEVAEQFLENEPAYLRGTHDASIVDEIPSRTTLEAIVGELRTRLYTDRRVLEIEAAGFEVAKGILDELVRGASDVQDRGNGASARSRKVLQLVPPEFLCGRCDKYTLVMKILDFYCSMTDSTAVSLFKKIRGISLPGR
ncbi:MAG: deoxyguanosinetriphosphate triphosphohydrolase [Bacteroidota bacterium]